MIQDKEHNYLFATNDGIYLYDYYTYQKIECDKTKSNSVFNFVIDRDGVIYCHNLNNQVFQIRKKECKLFYELSDEETCSDLSLAIADDGNLLIGAKKILVLNKTGKKVFYYDINKRYLGPVYRTKNNGILFHISSSDSVYSYSKGVFAKHKLLFSAGQPQNNGILKFFTKKDVTYAVDMKTKACYSYDPLNYELTYLPKKSLFERTESLRVYETGNELWVAGTLPGAALINDDLMSSDNTIYYNDYFISDVYKDKEGNTLLSTFDKGVLVIPDLKIPEVIHSFRDDPITALYSDNDMGLLLGSSRGKLTAYTNRTFITITKNGKRPIEGIYGDLKSNLIVFDDGFIRALNKQTNEIIDITGSSLKDAVFISEDQFYLGTNNGIIKCTREKKNKFKLEWLKDLNLRIYSLEYAPEKQLLYATTSNGLFSIDNVGASKKITYNNEDVFTKCLYYHKTKLYVTTSENGVLVIENNKVTNVILPTISGKTEELTKMGIHQNSIIAKSNNGFYQFNLKGELIRSLQGVFGLSGHRIIDFTFHQNQLWVNHSGGVQQINLNHKQAYQSNSVVSLNEVYVNDEKMSLSELSGFKSNQRKFQFIFSSPTLRNRESIHYYYKLIGYEKKWNINNYSFNQNTYNALAPGDYTFVVKSGNQGTFSAPKSYSFSISQPFYGRWWFILSAITVFLILVLIIYRRQLLLQRKKSAQINELNISKLIAIQSQMNPHFIFNALNSIQDLVLKGDVEHSYSYITTFSDLIRRTLNYSDKDFIDFDREIKLLELYLSLEKLRFKKNLNYEIDIANVADIMLPPLLIQPFIENSLIHGLLHKEGKKNLKITFELNEMLVCTIEDNGVGRERAKAIKLRQRSEHESFSGKAIHKRFEILSNIFGGDFGYRYEDLYIEGEAVGTKVTLNIPIKRKF